MILSKSLLYVSLSLWHTIKEGENLFIGICTEGAEEDRHWELPLSINSYVNDVVCIGLELDPCTTTWDNLGTEGLLTLNILCGEEYTERTSQLRYYYTLNTRDNEGSVVRHEWEVRHEDLLLLLCLLDEVL